MRTERLLTWVEILEFQVSVLDKWGSKNEILIFEPDKDLIKKHLHN